MGSQNNSRPQSGYQTRPQQSERATRPQSQREQKRVKIGGGIDQFEKCIEENAAEGWRYLGHASFSGCEYIIFFEK